MLEACIINHQNIDKIKNIYLDFKEKSGDFYKFELEPIDFTEFKRTVESGLLKGIALFEGDVVLGVLLYTLDISEALELNIIHTLMPNNFEHKEFLLTKLLEVEGNNPDYTVISYPMLGSQCDFSQNILKYNFSLVEEVVLKFDFSDCKPAEISLEPDYSIISWNNRYFDESAKIVHEEFKTSSDSLFETRFLTLEKTKEIIKNIVSEVYGDFLEDVTSVLLHKNIPVGIAFSNLTLPEKANIPLIAIKKEYQGKGFGKMLLNSVIRKLSDKIAAKSLIVQELNVTTSVDNVAVKMYKSLGFEEEYRYFHAYKPNKNRQ